MELTHKKSKFAHSKKKTEIVQKKNKLYITNKANKQPNQPKSANKRKKKTCTIGLAQFLDVLLYREVYESVMDASLKPSMHLRWIRRMEACIESAAQAVIQIVYTFRLTSENQMITSNDNNTSPFDGSQVSTLIYASILLSLYSIGSSVIKDDEWRFKAVWNKKLPPSKQ